MFKLLFIVLPFLAVYYVSKKAGFFFLLAMTILLAVIFAADEAWIAVIILAIFPVVSLVQYITIITEYDPEAENKIEKLLGKRELNDLELDELYWLRRKTRAVYLDSLNKLLNCELSMPFLKVWFGEYLGTTSYDSALTRKNISGRSNEEMKEIEKIADYNSKNLMGASGLQQLDEEDKRKNK